MRAGVSLAVRAGFAIVLMVLFYALAVAVAAVLVLLGLLLVRALPSVRVGRLMVLMVGAAAACVVAAAVIVWSVLPRLDRFEPPGPEVVEADHPRLFAEIRAIAAATGQLMPAHVYLVSEVNAFVAQRGGIMGIGSRRVMGIGLPLLRALQVDELRAVLAHEMGHFYGGDTRLGPWIYKTRGGLARTVFNLARVGHSTDHWISVVFDVVQAPFRWFLMGFMRVSQAISRAQEFSADAVAVRAEGTRAIIDGLKKTHAASIAHSVYLRTEVLPLVARGALPAVGEGFSRFLADDRFTRLLDEAVADELADGAADPYDSHPPLRERVAAAAALSGPERPPDPRRAIELVEDADRIESDDLAGQVERKLEPVAWDDTARLWIAAWREDVAQVKRVLAEVRVAAIPTDLPELYRLAARALGEHEANGADDDGLRQWWGSTAGSALAVILVDAGFTVTTHVGQPFVFTRGDATVEPFLELRKLVGGELSAEDWRARWTELGLADQNLA
jgi:Zn-dependent protease with chaperone function